VGRASCVCSSFPGSQPVTGPCGPVTSGDIQYCGADGSIAFDADFLNYLHTNFGALAPTILFAHEWGHMNLNSLGVSYSATRAACHAGVFVAYEKSEGRVLVTNPVEFFSSLCTSGAQQQFPWFLRDSCVSKETGFAHGYNQGTERLSTLCTNPIQVVRDICEP